MNIEKLKAAVNNENVSSAWDKGVKIYAYELLEEWEEGYGTENGGEFYGNPANYKELLNGASNWSRYSWGGCSLIYDGDIAARLCTPSELEKVRSGERRPNGHEEWLDTQARALRQAERLIRRVCERNRNAAEAI